MGGKTLSQSKSPPWGQNFYQELSIASSLVMPPTCGGHIGFGLSVCVCVCVCVCVFMFEISS